LYFEYVKLTNEPRKPSSEKQPADKFALIGYNRVREDPNMGEEGKKKLLTFKSEVIKKSLLNGESNLSDEKSKTRFSEVALKINYKIHRIFEEEFNEQNPQNIKNSVRNFIFYYIKIKEEMKENAILFDNIKQEIVLQIYRHLNRNDFLDKNAKIKAIFGFYYVFSFYFEIPPAILSPFKKWINELIQAK
jgi:hypothetical protein